MIMFIVVWWFPVHKLIGSLLILWHIYGNFRLHKSVPLLLADIWFIRIGRITHLDVDPRLILVRFSLLAHTASHLYINQLILIYIFKGNGRWDMDNQAGRWLYVALILFYKLKHFFMNIVGLANILLLSDLVRFDRSVAKFVELSSSVIPLFRLG